MRRMTLVAACLSLCAAAGAQSGEYRGAEIVPRWNDDGELILEVNSWTKLPVSLDNIEVEVRLAGGEPCRYTHAGTLNLKPTDTMYVTLATSDAMQRCRAAQRPTVARAARLRFGRIAVAAGAVAPTDVVSIKADLTVAQERAVSRSQWRVETED